MVIARIFGGLGNQLFIYAAARRLALKNNVPLKLDIISGFKKNYYKRDFQLGHFNIKAEIASKIESFDFCMGRQIQYIIKKAYTILPFEKRKYIVQGTQSVVQQLLDLKVKGKIYLEGYWQSAKYFEDIESVIREDLKISTKHEPENEELARKISSCNAVSLHARRLHEVPETKNAKPKNSLPALSLDYYLTSIEKIANIVPNPHFFCFSDFPGWLEENLKIDYPLTFITHNRHNKKDYEDLWLMSLCKHHITANSTFSWWGAWLSENSQKMVCWPDPKIWPYSVHDTKF